MVDLDYIVRNGKNDLIVIYDDTYYGEVRGEGESLFEAIMDFDKNYRMMKKARNILDTAIHNAKQKVSLELDDFSGYKHKEDKTTLEDVFNYKS